MIAGQWCLRTGWHEFDVDEKYIDFENTQTHIAYTHYTKHRCGLRKKHTHKNYIHTNTHTDTHRSTFELKKVRREIEIVNFRNVHAFLWIMYWTKHHAHIFTLCSNWYVIQLLLYIIRLSFFAITVFFNLFTYIFRRIFIRKINIHITIFIQWKYKKTQLIRK